MTKQPRVHRGDTTTPDAKRPEKKIFTLPRTGPRSSSSRSKTRSALLLVFLPCLRGGSLAAQSAECVCECECARVCERVCSSPVRANHPQPPLGTHGALIGCGAAPCRSQSRCAPAAERLLAGTETRHTGPLFIVTLTLRSRPDRARSHVRASHYNIINHREER